jgi:hypothetical protein
MNFRKRDLKCGTDMKTKAPSLTTSLKPLGPNFYEISLVHPNTKKVLYTKEFKGDANAAFAFLKNVRDTQFADVATKYDPPKEIRKKGGSNPFR